MVERESYDPANTSVAGDRQRQTLSALMDGEVPPDEVARFLDATAKSEHALSCWRTYHLIGESLKFREQPDTAVRADFAARVRAQIESEVALRGPDGRDSLLVPRFPDNSDRERARNTAAANDAVFRWRALASLAVACTVGALGWASVERSWRQGERELASNAPAGAGRPPAAAVMLRDPALDEMLAAHRQLGGVSALQLPAGFVRNAAFDSGHR